MNTEPKPGMDVSVIIPMYNAEAYIKGALDSVIRQKPHGLNIEVIVIDDCSTDASVDAVVPYLSDSIIMIRLPVNGGLSNARNTGLDAAKGEWVQFLDSDDRLDSNLFHEFGKVMDKAFDAFLYGIIYEYKDKSLVHQFIKAKDKRAFGHLSCAVNKLIRRDKCVRFEKGFLFEDVIFSVDMMRQDLNLAILPEVYYHYNCRNSASIIANFKAHEFVRMYKYVFSKLNSYDRLTRMYLCEIFVAIALDRSRPFRMRMWLALRTSVRLFYLLPAVLLNQNRKTSKMSVRLNVR